MATLETKSVQEVYDRIAESFSQTRRTVWGGVRQFLDQIKPGSKVLEVGCGNGRNLLYLMNREVGIHLSGCDFSTKLCEIAQQKVKSAKIVQANNLDLQPYQDNSFDYTLSVAVIHHLSNEDRRKMAIEELVRVTKPGGSVLITVWAFEQPENSKNQFTEQDTMVPWQRDREEPEYRFYHVFKQGELDQLVAKVTNCRPREPSFYDRGNWQIVLTKNV